MRLIDADELMEKSWDVDCRIGYVQVVDVGDILDATTINAVEVVRCRDCVMLQHCRFAQGLGLNGFCSQGDRKNETD